MNSVRKVLYSAIARGRTKLPVTLKQRLSVEEMTLQLGDPRLVCEEMLYQTETESTQGWVPLRIVQARRTEGDPKRPAVIFLHGTTKDMEVVLSYQREYALAGYLTAAIDCRYHGLRKLTTDHPDPLHDYTAALVSAWRGTSPERPFLLDNVWDLIHLLDLLQARDDVDCSRIGMTGISLGGMHTWLCSAVDERVAVAAPMIGVQGFKWAIHNNQIEGRVSSMQGLFDTAAKDAGSESITPELVAQVWSRILPGLLETYDAPMSLPCIAPRPLLVANGELDPRCPMQGVHEAMDAARAAYEAAGAGDRLQLFVDPGRNHEVSPEMRAEVRKWLDMHLAPSAGLKIDCCRPKIGLSRN